MRIGRWIKTTISVIAILCNLAGLLWLVYAIFRTPPTGSELSVPVVLGAFLVLNLAAITLASLGTFKSVRASLRPGPGIAKVRRVLFAVVLLGCLGLGFWIGFSSRDTIRSWKWERVKQAKYEKFIAKKAPDIVTQRLDGTEWRLEDQRGKVVLIDFWATWCVPCVAAMPRMKEVYEKYKSRQDFAMVGICLDKDRDAPVKFCEEHQILWPQLFEENRGWANGVAVAFQTQAIPSVCIIDKKGVVAGMDLPREHIELTIEKCLNEVPADSNS